MSVFISIQQKLYEMSPSSSISALYNLGDKLLTRLGGVRGTRDTLQTYVDTQIQMTIQAGINTVKL